jgi:NADH-quinone oxidoreductase subunit G
MPFVTVDGKQIEVQNGLTVLQACEAAGAEIPRFCYHERLEIAGNCRMCLVKVEKMPKPVASCAHPVGEGMVIHTNTPEVQKMRQGVMEFLLINHPLDCPICDQGGECDLQDQAMFYGVDKSRYSENKRSVPDKYMGPLVKTSMTRCIHCTRCIRFIEDVAGTCELGAVNRGEDMAVTTFIEKSITSELSGNIIDICPVGALTSKPYAFKARPWELSHTESIDVLDAVGSNIRVDTKGNTVMRILPRLHDDINEEWLSDKGRFACDGLNYQRLDVPMLREENKLIPTSWEQALAAINSAVKKASSQKIAAIAGDLTDVETMLTMKEMLNALGSPNYDCRQDGANLSSTERGQYIFNTTIAGIEKSDLCLIIGANPRQEAPLVCSRIRKAQRHNNMKVLVIGEKVDLAMDYRYLGQNPWILKQIAEGQHPICKLISEAKNPMLIIGSGTLARDDYEATLYNAKRICSKYGFVKEGWNGYNILLDIGFVPGANGLNTESILSDKTDVLFLLGADEVDLKKINSKTFVVYLGHHGDRAAARADVILPCAAYTEKTATYVNLEGRAQRTKFAISPLGEAKEDWLVVCELAKVLGHDLGYRKIADIWQKMAKLNPVFTALDLVRKETFSLESGKLKDFNNDLYENPIINYYQTDPISRASRTMAKCAKEILGILRKEKQAA